MVFKKNSLFIDIGATSIKIRQLNLELPTPSRSSPSKLLSLLKKISVPSQYKCIYIGFPGIVVDGITLNAPNLDNSRWRNFHLQQALKNLYKRTVFVYNDADLHGLKVVKGDGLELVISLGTGVGSALFYNGELIPNLELGHLPFKDNFTFEELLGLKSFRKIPHKKWENLLLKALNTWRNLFSPKHLYLTGGLSLTIKSIKIKSQVQIIGNP